MTFSSLYFLRRHSKIVISTSTQHRATSVDFILYYWWFEQPFAKIKLSFVAFMHCDIPILRFRSYNAIHIVNIFFENTNSTNIRRKKKRKKLIIPYLQLFLAPTMKYNWINQFSSRADHNTRLEYSS